MSNPTLLVASFADSLAYTSPDGTGVFVGVDPIRYDGGLWLEEGTVNLFPNPISENDDGSWGNYNGGSGGRVTSEHLFGSASIEFTSSNVSADERVQPVFASSLTSPRTFTESVYTKVASGSATLQLQSIYVYTSGLDIDQASSVVTTDWARMTPVTMAMSDPKTMSSIYASIGTGAIQQAVTLFATGLQIEEKPYATSLAVGSFGAGYSWDVGAHTSASIRDASSALVPTVDHIDPATGTLALQLTRLIDTGAEEMYFECGTVGSGTDALRGGVDAADHPFVEWNSNNAGWERLTSAALVSTGTEFVYLADWDGTVTRLQIDDAAIESGTRDAVEGDWGAGDLVLEAA